MTGMPADEEAEIQPEAEKVSEEIVTLNDFLMNTGIAEILDKYEGRN